MFLVELGDAFAATSWAEIVAQGRRPTAEEAQRLNEEELLVLRLAMRESIGSARPAGRFRRALDVVFGIKHPTRLANSRLEALRSAAVFLREGFRRDTAIANLREHGFTADQIDAINRHCETYAAQTRGGRQA